MLPIGYHRQFDYLGWSEETEQMLRRLISELNYTIPHPPGEFFDEFPAYNFVSGNIDDIVKTARHWYRYGGPQGACLSLRFHADPIFEGSTGNHYLRLSGEATGSTLPEDSNLIGTGCLIYRENEERFRIMIEQLEGVAYGGHRESYWFELHDQAVLPILRNLLTQLTIERAFSGDENCEIGFDIAKMITGSLDNVLVTAGQLFKYSIRYTEHLSKLHSFRDAVPPFLMKFQILAEPCFRYRDERFQVEVEAVALFPIDGTNLDGEDKMLLFVLRREGENTYRLVRPDFKKLWEDARISLRCHMLNDGVPLSDFIQAYQTGEGIVYSRLGYPMRMPDLSLSIEPFLDFTDEENESEPKDES